MAFKAYTGTPLSPFDAYENCPVRVELHRKMSGIAFRITRDTQMQYVTYANTYVRTNQHERVHLPSGKTIHFLLQVLKEV